MSRYFYGSIDRTGRLRSTVCESSTAALRALVLDETGGQALAGLAIEVRDDRTLNILGAWQDIPRELNPQEAVSTIAKFLQEAERRWDSAMQSNGPNPFERPQAVPIPTAGVQSVLRR